MNVVVVDPSLEVPNSSKDGSNGVTRGKGTGGSE